MDFMLVSSISDDSFGPFSHHWRKRTVCLKIHWPRLLKGIIVTSRARHAVMFKTLKPLNNCCHFLLLTGKCFTILILIAGKLLRGLNIWCYNPEGLVVASGQTLFSRICELVFWVQDHHWYTAGMGSIWSAAERQNLTRRGWVIGVICGTVMDPHPSSQIVSE